MDVKFITPTPIPASVYELAQKVKSAFQHKTIDLELLQQMGSELWDYSNLPTDFTNISKLIIQHNPELPWEYLYHPDGYFIAQHIPIIRQIDKDTPKFQKIQQPLKILHFATQTESSDKHYLNFAEEQHFIYQALWPQIQSKQILLHSSPCGDFAQFSTLLNQSWDVIILSGHSVTVENQQYLVFESSQLISYEQVAAMLQNTLVQYVILAFCESNDLALKLHQMGIFNVIGMQYTVLDRAASLFMHHWCQSLVQGQPCDKAVQTARLAMQKPLAANEQWQENEIGQWLMPCFYTYLAEISLSFQDTTSSECLSSNLLIGRRKQLCQLENLLLQHGKVWLYGVGGIGKTALAKALQQYFIVQHKTINYVEVERNEPMSNKSPILAVSRFPPPNSDWTGFKLSVPSENEFIRYVQYRGLAYPELQLRLIYKMLRGNYQGLQLLQGLPFSTEALILRQQLRTVQRYLQAYQNINQY